MFITEVTKFKCPYCNNEYYRIVGSGENYIYKDNIYHYEICQICKKDFLVNGEESVVMPEDKSEVKFHSRWMS